MEVRTTSLDGMFPLSRPVHTDARGSYEVIWSRGELAAAYGDLV
jgi:hypothetical protein